MTAREQLVAAIDNCCELTSQEDCDKYHSESLNPCNYCVLAKLLSLKHPNGGLMLGILSEDQSLPDVTNLKSDMITMLEWGRIIQHDMKSANFRRIVKE